ncbi:MAG: hypothetical protein KGJ86_07895, partial [Chloroflexota bacterium]|nr:hypothetical protein [Chloroflexota bacterium]
YSEQDLRNVDPDRRQRHFTQTADGPWAINRDIRSMVTIRRHDVLHDAFEAHFNLIVCRNVVIYFTEDAKQKLYRRLWQALSPGGYLFVGATEIVTNTAAIGFSSDLLSFYRKDPNATPKGELTRAN